LFEVAPALEAVGQPAQAHGNPRVEPNGLIDVGQEARSPLGLAHNGLVSLEQQALRGVRVHAGQYRSNLL
jgi:hypothetical protein